MKSAGTRRRSAIALLLVVLASGLLAALKAWLVSRYLRGH